MKLRLYKNNRKNDFQIKIKNSLVHINDKKHIFDIKQISNNLYSLIVDNKSYFLSFEENSDFILIDDSKSVNEIFIQNELDILIEEFSLSKSESEATELIKAPIPGILTKIFVKIGDKVTSKSKICILEAMKMENEIICPTNGIVTSIYIEEGSSVKKNQLIMEIKSNVLE